MVSFALLLAVCFLACTLGPICGIGGGVIIKPAIDALGLMSVSAASFLSGVTVLLMSLFTIGRRTRARTLRVDMRVMLPISLGAAAGGAAGKAAFSTILTALGDADLVGGTQAAVLLALTLLSVVYTVRKDALPHLRLQGVAARTVLGVASGAAWSFLGIGGGPFNLVLLVFFLSMDTATASQASLLIIAFSQTAGLLYLLVAGGIPAFPPQDLVGMAVMAILGSLAGMHVSGAIDNDARDHLYIAALVVIALICGYNLVSFLG